MRSICWKDKTVDGSASDARNAVSLDHDCFVNFVDRFQRRRFLASNQARGWARSAPKPQESQRAVLAFGPPNDLGRA